jgi:hypothetical protein
MSEDPQYPTRSYPYRARLDRAGPAPSRDLDVSFGESVETRDVPGLKARLVGVDPYAGREMSPGELERLDDPLARLLLKRGTFPRTLQQLLDALNAFNADPGGVPHQNVFFISEWGQIPLNSTTASYPRQIRYILTRGRNEIGAADILVSTAPPSDDAGIFLQVAAWDRTNEVFHFYDRSLRTSTWFWAGSSWHALAPPTRGKGPFDSHVNGAPVMKERKEPWLHWHSISQDIPRQNFPPGHPINRASEDAFVNQCQSAHLLQTQIVEPAVQRWTDARLRRVLGSSGIADPGALMRQVLTATSVNIVSARQRSRSAESDIEIPLTLLVDAETLLKFLPDAPLKIVRVPRPLYEQAISTLQISLRDTQQGFQQAGDAFFAWAVPERAFEDIVVVEALVRRGVLSARFATALLMIDFTNPIDSARRAALMKHVPSVTVQATGTGGLQAKMLQSIEAAAGATGTNSEEAEIVRFMALREGDWQAEAERRVTALVDAVEARAKTRDGAIDYLRLADSRRRAFRRNRHLAEFDLSLPFSSVADGAPAVELLPDGTVVQRPETIAPNAR